MNEQSQKVLTDLLQKASNGIDSAVSFSQAQIPDVVHQLLVWKFVNSLIITIFAITSIPLVLWFMKKQLRKVPDGVIGCEGYSWDSGRTKYAETLIWDKKGEISFASFPLGVFLFIYGCTVIGVLTNLTWLKIWLAPKLYLIEYAASLVK